MKRNKKHILNKHKENKKIVKEAVLKESEDVNNTRFFDSVGVKYTTDTGKWYSKVEFTALETGYWNDQLVNKKIFVMEDFDGNVEITVDYMSDKQKITIPIHILGDIIAAGQILEHYRGNVFAKMKLVKKK